jgi:hypothetical protein
MEALQTGIAAVGKEDSAATGVDESTIQGGDGPSSSRPTRLFQSSTTQSSGKPESSDSGEANHQDQALSGDSSQTGSDLASQSSTGNNPQSQSFDQRSTSNDGFGSRDEHQDSDEKSEDYNTDSQGLAEKDSSEPGASLSSRASDASASEQETGAGESGEEQQTGGNSRQGSVSAIDTGETADNETSEVTGSVQGVGEEDLDDPQNPESHSRKDSVSTTAEDGHEDEDELDSDFDAEDKDTPDSSVSGMDEDADRNDDDTSWDDPNSGQRDYYGQYAVPPNVHISSDPDSGDTNFDVDSPLYAPDDLEDVQDSEVARRVSNSYVDHYRGMNYVANNGNLSTADAQTARNAARESAGTAIALRNRAQILDYEGQGLDPRRSSIDGAHPSSMEVSGNLSRSDSY